MPCEVNRRFLVLYGSQRGQAQSIAEGIADEAGEQGLVADIFCLSQQDKVSNSVQSLLNGSFKNQSPSSQPPSLAEG